MVPPLKGNLVGELMDVHLPPLVLKWSFPEQFVGEKPDMVLNINFPRAASYKFAVFYRSQWTPRVIEAAVRKVEQMPYQPGLPPLVLVPYLSEEQLIALEARGMSGLDLCGNGVVTAPGFFLVFRTGKPNRFSSSAPIKNVYQGATSLVTRAFLLQPVYSSVGALGAFVSARNGTISLATVSKALHGLEDDLVVTRDKGGLHLLQPSKLLDLLERNYRPVRISQTITGRVALAPSPLRQALLEQTGAGKTRIAATGVSSASHYATLAMEEKTDLYCSDLRTLLADLPFEPTNRFPNLRLIQTDDPTAFFDTRPDSTGYPWASPIQTYLEMRTEGDPRLRQSATAVREGLTGNLVGGMVTGE